MNGSDFGCSSSILSAAWTTDADSSGLSEMPGPGGRLSFGSASTRIGDSRSEAGAAEVAGAVGRGAGLRAGGFSGFRVSIAPRSGDSTSMPKRKDPRSIAIQRAPAFKREGRGGMLWRRGGELVGLSVVIVDK
jgi:hypothetical protein